MTLEPLLWLWPGRLALGKLSLLDGDPGLGKSHLALDLCARLSTGRPLPDGSPAPGVCSSIYLNAEDGAGDTIRPRLLALNADPNRVFILDGTAHDGLLCLPRQTAQLNAALDDTKAKLVVLDPAIAFLDSSVIDSSNQSVRRALLPLGELAERHHAAILMVRHLNKEANGRSIYRGAGSIGFMGACRSAWLMGNDPADPSRRVLAQLKNNLAPRQPSLVCSVVPHGEGRTELCWLGESPLTAEQLLATRSLLSKRAHARLFLRDFLGCGPRTSRDIWDAALPLGYSKRTLFRARKELSIRVLDHYEGRHRSIYWLLPGQSLPHPPGTTPDIIDEMLAALHKDLPLSSPLDNDDTP